MDHSENDRRFCVYVHLDEQNNIRYIGSGTKNRYVKKSGRNKEHLLMWDKLDKRVIHSNLTKQEASEIEVNLINSNWDSGLLLNIVRKSTLAKRISYTEISKYLEYDESSPSCLRWKGTKLKPGMKNNKIAGYKSKVGYWVCCINYNSYKVHRLVWVLNNKKDLISNMVIDHIDRDKSNNKITNLRLVTHQDNCINSDTIQNAAKVHIWWTKRNFYTIRIICDDGKTNVERYFSPHILFPLLDNLEAKLNTIKLLEIIKDFIAAKKDERGLEYLDSSWVRANVLSKIKRNKPFSQSLTNFEKEIKCLI